MSIRERLAKLAPETDQESTLLSGLGLVSLGFMVAQLLGSILYLPLSLVIPGAVLTLVGLRAKATEVAE